MMFETGYREFMLQNPYMITVDSDAKSHISFFFIRPWWGNQKWGCRNKRIQEVVFERQCPEIECQNAPDGTNKCKQCMMLPFASSVLANVLCVIR